MKPIVVGTRGSELAVRQAESMVQYLIDQGLEVTWKRFTTSGDAWLAGPLDKQVGTGFFTKELEDSLEAREADLLIHSFKDVALERPAGVIQACVPLRENPEDWLVMRPDAPSHPVIGTSSERRRRFLEKALPHASFTWIRGNVPTRLQRVRDGLLRDEPLHGTVLAAAGLERLGLDLSGLEVRPLRADELLPAPAQGALLAETREDRRDIVEALKGFHDAATARCARLERLVLAGIGGGCQQPLGAHALLLPNGDVRLRAAFAGEDGLRWAEAEGEDEIQVVKEVVKGLGW
ncbi:MAG: hydroxymethylbilane synthase [Firmicutes bacterium]|nr:hydroxymethylbilane synthase [Bacillota bacterium]